MTNFEHLNPCFIVLGWWEITLKYVEHLVKDCSRGVALKDSRESLLWSFNA